MVEKKVGDNQMGKTNKQNNNSNQDQQPSQGLTVSRHVHNTLVFSSITICGI